MTIGSLFSGIGGLELGLEWAGLGPVLWQVEQDEYCRAVLARHWPKAERFADVREVGASNLKPVGVLCGGWPCQDLSYAGKGAGLGGARSGLWTEYARIIGELRPRIVVMENSPALLARGFGVVLGDLARLGYDAEWSCVSACSVGAPHMRQRLFVVAYANSINGEARIRGVDTWARQIQPADSSAGARAEWRERVANPSKVFGSADGVPGQLDRVRALGNAVVPQVAYVVGMMARELIGDES
jgi:DNA (cytosine-5)-methyltransferase 1